jgi:hypothetical protein
MKLIPISLLIVLAILALTNWQVLVQAVHEVQGLQSVLQQIGH